MRLGFLFLLSSGNARGSIPRKVPESDHLLLATFSEYVANLSSLQQIIFNYLSRLNLLLILGHYYLSFWWTECMFDFNQIIWSWTGIFWATIFKEILCMGSKVNSYPSADVTCSWIVKNSMKKTQSSQPTWKCCRMRCH